jgi:hypothetical protein
MTITEMLAKLDDIHAAALQAIRQRDALRARLATVEAERDAAWKRAEPFDRCVAAFAKTWKVGLGWDSDEKTAFLKTREQLDNAIREAAKAQLDGEHNV